MHPLRRYIIDKVEPRRMMMTLLIVLAAPLSLSAQTVDTTLADHLQKEMYRLFSTDETDSFIAVTDQLKEVAQKMGDSRLFYKTWSNQAIYYNNKYRSRLAMRLMEEVRKHAMKEEDKFGLYTSTYVAATLMSSANLLDGALDYYQKAINYQHRFFPNESAAAPYLGMAKVYWNLSKHDSVDWCAEQVFKEPNVIMYHQLTAWSYKCLALVHEDRDGAFLEHIDRDEYNRCYEEREKVKLAYGHDDQMGVVVSFYHALANGKTKEAHELISKMRNGQERLNKLGLINAMLGNYRDAYVYARQYKTLSDSLKNMEALSQYSELALELDLARNKAETKELRLENQTMWLWAGGIIALLTLSFLGFYLYYRRRQLDALRQAYDKLEETSTAKQRIDSELRIARDIQMSMVPTNFEFPDHPEVDLYASMTPARQVGGDLYDFVLLNNKLYLCVGDVSGKGVPASMTMAVVVNLFRSVAKEGFPAQYIVTKLNDVLADDNENAMFVTMFVAMINLDTGQMEICNAGHNPPVIIDAQHPEFHKVIPNAPVGLWKDLEFESEFIDDIRYRPLIIYTDGLNEAENSFHHQFGMARILEVLSWERFENARRTVEMLERQVQAHVGTAEPSDDLTIMCVCIK